MAEGGTPATRRRVRSITSRPWVGMAVALLVAVAFVGLAALIVRRTSVQREQFWSDAVGALLTVAGGVVITGVVGVMVNRLRDRELAERRVAEFVEGQIVDLWAIREQVMRSAVLIAAHRTAKTYGEQLREIIGLRTKLADVQGVVERRDGELRGLHVDALRQQLDTALRFLHPLIDEYRASYKEISARQSVDEAINRADFAKGLWQNPSRGAWNELRDHRRFPQLNKLIRFGELDADEYASDAHAYGTACLTLELLDPIALAVQILRARDRGTWKATERAIDDHRKRLEAATDRCGRAPTDAADTGADVDLDLTEPAPVELSATDPAPTADVAPPTS